MPRKLPENKDTYGLQAVRNFTYWQARVLCGHLRLEVVMPYSEESSEESFQHFYRYGLRDLEFDQMQARADKEQQQELPRRILLEEYEKMIGEVIKFLTMAGPDPDPDLVLQNGLNALRRIEHFRFVLGNLLEAVKRDDSLENSLIRYQQLELLGFTVPSDLTGEKAEERKSPWRFNPGSGHFLRKLLDRLRKAALTIMEIVANAIKVSSKLISIKPKPSIGLSGPFPTFSLEFDLEAESITIHELFHDLKEGLSAP
jgi:hypothetical protein